MFTVSAGARGSEDGSYGWSRGPPAPALPQATSQLAALTKTSLSTAASIYIDGRDERKQQDPETQPNAAIDGRGLHQSSLLPPSDGGASAWKFLFGAFIVEAFQWGFTLSFGVFQDFYSSHAPFAESGSKYLPVVGTLETAGFYLGAPMMVPLIQRFPRSRRQMIWAGWAISIIALVAASFATTVNVLIVTQGLLYSLGILLVGYPIIGMLNEWFIEKRGLAFGIMIASTGLSGIAMPFVFATLLAKYGFATTLRAFSLALFLLTGATLPLLKERFPSDHRTNQCSTPLPPASRKCLVKALASHVSFVKRSRFWFFVASVLLQGLAYSFPILFLPSYASLLGFSPNVGALLLALCSLMQVPGQITVGYLSDRKVSVEILAFVTPMVSGLSIWTLWGLARTLTPLVVFSLLYGFFGGGYVVLWAKMGLELSDDPKVALTLFGCFNFLKGVGNMLTGPISGVLMTQEVSLIKYGLGRYENIVLYCGSCMSSCAFIMIVLCAAGRLRNQEA